MALVEALCSDRWYVAGELRLIHVASGDIKHVDTRGVDINCVEWRSTDKVLLAGMEADELDSYLARTELSAFQKATITDKKALRQELKKIRAQGFAESKGELFTGGGALAAGPACDAVARLEDIGRNADLTQAAALYAEMERHVQALDAALSDWVN